MQDQATARITFGDITWIFCEDWDRPQGNHVWLPELCNKCGSTMVSRGDVIAKWDTNGNRSDHHKNCI